MSVRYVNVTKSEQRSLTPYLALASVESLTHWEGHSGVKEDNASDLLVNLKALEDTDHLNEEAELDDNHFKLTSDGLSSLSMYAIRQVGYD